MFLTSPLIDQGDNTQTSLAAHFECYPDVTPSERLSRYERRELTPEITVLLSGHDPSSALTCT